MASTLSLCSAVRPVCQTRQAYSTEACMYCWLIKVQHVCTRRASSPEHAQKLDPLACFGADALHVRMWLIQERSLDMITPSILAELICFSTLPAMVKTGSFAALRAKDTIISLVLSALSCTSLFADQTVASSRDVLYDRVFTWHQTRLLSHSVVNILRALAMLQQIINHQEQDDLHALHRFLGALCHVRVARQWHGH